jgi:hypothetical protein
MDLPAAITQKAAKAAARYGRTFYCFTTYTGWKIDQRTPPFPGTTTYWAVAADGSVTYHPNKWAA